MNYKILPQLLDVARTLGTDGNKALSITLHLLCWWKLSKEQLISLVVLRRRLPEFYPPEMLLIYLRSPIGQGVLSRMTVSVSIPSIQLSALKDMEIPVAPLKEMQQMAHVFHKEAKFQTEIEQLRIRQAELTKEFWSLQ